MLTTPEFSSEDLPFFNFDQAAGIEAADDHSDTSSHTLSDHPEWDPASESLPDHAPDENLPTSPHDKPNHCQNDEASGNRRDTSVIPVPQDAGLDFSSKKRSFDEFYEEDRREFEMTLEMMEKAIEEAETAVGKASKILKDFRMKCIERLLFGEDEL
jgi:hypothetical protein